MWQPCYHLLLIGLQMGLWSPRKFLGKNMLADEKDCEDVFIFFSVLNVVVGRYDGWKCGNCFDRPEGKALWKGGDLGTSHCTNSETICNCRVCKIIKCLCCLCHCWLMCCFLPLSTLLVGSSYPHLPFWHVLPYFLSNSYSSLGFSKTWFPL